MLTHIRTFYVPTISIFVSTCVNINNTSLWYNLISHRIPFVHAVISNLIYFSSTLFHSRISHHTRTNSIIHQQTNVSPSSYFPTKWNCYRKKSPQINTPSPAKLKPSPNLRINSEPRSTYRGIIGAFAIEKKPRNENVLIFTFPQSNREPRAYYVILEIITQKKGLDPIFFSLDFSHSTTIYSIHALFEVYVSCNFNNHLDRQPCFDFFCRKTL